MTRLRHLLQAADPIGHEPQGEAERDRIRRAVIAAARDSSATPRGVSRRSAAVVAAAALMIAAGVVIGPHLWSPGGTTLQAAVRFEVRLAEEQPAAGLQTVQIARSTRVVYLHPEVIVTNADVAQSRVVPGSTPSQFWIDVQFNATGAEKMRRATTNHIGKPVAILIDGDVVMAPTVKSAIGAAAMITGDYTRADAERIADGIAANP